MKKLLIAVLFSPILAFAQAITPGASVIIGGASGGGSGSGVALQQTITQANSFAVGNVVGNNGTTWVLAEANSGGVQNSLGLVTAATGSNFTIVTAGLATGLSGLTQGTRYYLSDSSAGATTSTPPSTTSSSQITIYDAQSTTSAIVNPPLIASNALFTVGQLTPPAVSLGNLTGTVNIPWANGFLYYGTLTGNTTFTFSGAVSGESISVRVYQTGTNSFTVTWPTVSWPNNTAPTMTTGKAAHDTTSLNFMNATYDGNSVQSMQP